MMSKSMEEFHAALQKTNDEFTAELQDRWNHLLVVMEQKIDAALQQIFAIKDVDKLPGSDEKRAYGGTIVLPAEAHEVVDKNPIDKILASKLIGGYDEETVSPITACKVFDELTEPILGSSQSINQVLGVPSESKNGIERCGMTFSVASGLKLSHPSTMMEGEYSSSSFSRNEVSFSFSNPFSYEAGKLLNDRDFQPTIGSVKVTHQLFDKMPQPLVFAPNHKMYIDKVYVPPLSPLSDYVPQIFYPGGVSLTILGGIIDRNGVNRDFDLTLGKPDGELWVGKMMLFTFDPGGSSWLINGCDAFNRRSNAFEFRDDRQHQDHFSAIKVGPVLGWLCFVYSIDVLIVRLYTSKPFDIDYDIMAEAIVNVAHCKTRGHVAPLMLLYIGIIDNYYFPAVPFEFSDQEEGRQSNAALNYVGIIMVKAASLELLTIVLMRKTNYRISKMGEKCYIPLIPRVFDPGTTANGILDDQSKHDIGTENKAAKFPNGTISDFKDDAWNYKSCEVSTSIATWILELDVELCVAKVSLLTFDPGAEGNESHISRKVRTGRVSSRRLLTLRKTVHSQIVEELYQSFDEGLKLNLVEQIDDMESQLLPLTMAWLRRLDCGLLVSKYVWQDLDTVPSTSLVELWFGRVSIFTFDPGGGCVYLVDTVNANHLNHKLRIKLHTALQIDVLAAFCSIIIWTIDATIVGFTLAAAQLGNLGGHFVPIHPWGQGCLQEGRRENAMQRGMMVWIEVMLSIQVVITCWMEHLQRRKICIVVMGSKGGLQRQSCALLLGNKGNSKDRAVLICEQRYSTEDNIAPYLPSRMNCRVTWSTVSIAHCWYCRFRVIFVYNKCIHFGYILEDKDVFKERGQEPDPFDILYRVKFNELDRFRLEV